LIYRNQLNLSARGRSFTSCTAQLRVRWQTKEETKCVIVLAATQQAP
jgi:hypothetical protein